MNDKEIIQEIIRIIETCERDAHAARVEGWDVESDGECLDKLWSLLETNNYI